MAQSPRIDVELAEGERGAVATVTVDNRAKLNVVGRTLLERLVEEIEALGLRDDLRAVVLTGAGDRAFIGGADIAEMAALDRATAADFISLVHRACDSVRRCPVPVIARIDGYALGAGLELAVSCDLRIATTRARFGMSEVRVGIPSVVEAALIPRLVGFGRARELLLGELVDAEAALRIGLIERLVAPERLDREVSAVVASLLAAGPQAVRRQKALLRQWESVPLEHAIAAGIKAFAASFETDEPRMMMSAFLDRRR